MLEALPAQLWDLMIKAIASLPNYLADATSLISGPKRFVLKRVSSEQPHLTDALLFLTISFMISWTLQISFVKESVIIDLSEDATFFALYVFASVALSAWLGAALRLLVTSRSTSSFTSTTQA
jgi:hypothetical protein